MAQQSKITSRPLTKALGTASILGLAIAGANFANAIQTDFGVEYQAHAFAIDSGAFADPAAQPLLNPLNPAAGRQAPASRETDTGLANLLRLKANFKDRSEEHTSELQS